MMSVSGGMLSVSGKVGGCVLAWKGLGVTGRRRPVARPASLFLDSGRGWSPREAWHCSERGQGWAGAPGPLWSRLQRCQGGPRREEAAKRGASS